MKQIFDFEALIAPLAQPAHLRQPMPRGHYSMHLCRNEAGFYVRALHENGKLYILPVTGNSDGTVTFNGRRFMP